MITRNRSAGIASNYNDALERACLGGHFDIIQLLLTHRAKEEIPVPVINYGRCIMSAACYGQLEVMQFMVSLASHECVAPDLSFALDSALSYAASNGYLEIVHWLLSFNPNPNLALVNAAGNNQTEIVYLLLARGANNYNDAMANAASWDALEMVELMIQHGANDFNSALESTATHGQTKMCLYLLQRGANNYDISIERAIRNSFVATADAIREWQQSH